MDNLVKDEEKRINAPEVNSEFEKEVMGDVYAWASEKYKDNAIGRHFSELRDAFWQEKLDGMGVRQIVR